MCIVLCDNSQCPAHTVKLLTDDIEMKGNQYVGVGVGHQDKEELQVVLSGA